MSWTELILNNFLSFLRWETWWPNDPTYSGRNWTNSCIGCCRIHGYRSTTPYRFHTCSTVNALQTVNGRIRYVHFTKFRTFKSYKSFLSDPHSCSVLLLNRHHCNCRDCWLQIRQRRSVATIFQLSHTAFQIQVKHSYFYSTTSQNKQLHIFRKQNQWRICKTYKIKFVLLNKTYTTCFYDDYK